MYQINYASTVNLVDSTYNKIHFFFLETVDGKVHYGQNKKKNIVAILVIFRKYGYL